MNPVPTVGLGGFFRPTVPGWKRCEPVADIDPGSRRVRRCGPSILDEDLQPLTGLTVVLVEPLYGDAFREWQYSEEMSRTFNFVPTLRPTLTLRIPYMASTVGYARSTLPLCKGL